MRCAVYSGNDPGATIPAILVCAGGAGSGASGLLPRRGAVLGAAPARAAPIARAREPAARSARTRRHQPRKPYRTGHPYISCITYISFL